MYPLAIRHTTTLSFCFFTRLWFVCTALITNTQNLKFQDHRILKFQDSDKKRKIFVDLSHTSLSLLTVRTDRVRKIET